MHLALKFFTIFFCCFYSFFCYAEKDYIQTHAISILGDVKYPPQFTAFDYVNLNAPKGGKIILSSSGGFDTLNAFNGKGNPAPGLSLLYDSLTKSSLDEPATEYGLLAETIRYAKDYSWVEYDLNKKAIWSDGQKITSKDVVFSLNLLKEKGSPIYRYYYVNIDKAIASSDHTVRFLFNSKGNKELPMISGQLPILPAHYWKDKDFTKATLSAPITSGPYRVKAVSPNRSITYQKNPNYWGKDINVNKGYYNFDMIHYDIYQDAIVEFEAFKAGAYDMRHEYSAKNWVKGYNFPAVSKGEVIKKTFKTLHPKPMQGLIFNLRRPFFQDSALREAINLTFDFEWLNQNIFFNSYKRTESFFQESPLQAPKIPTSQEIALFNEFPGTVSKNIFHDNKKKTSRDLRSRIRKAHLILKDAGYSFKKGQLFNQEGQKIAFTILGADPSFERVLLPIKENIQKLGIDVTLLIVDGSHYSRLVNQFEFDMIMSVYAQSSSPGNEQREYWGSQAAKRFRSRNYAGLQDRLLDFLIDKVIFAQDREALITATHALDRTLQAKKFLIPLWYSPFERIAFKNHLGMPKTQKGYGINSHFHLWWSKDIL